MEHFKKLSFPSVRSSLPKHGHECKSFLIKRMSSEQQLEGSNRADCNTRFSLPRDIHKEKEPVTVTESGWKENGWIFGVNQQSKRRMLQGRALPPGCSSTLWAVPAAMYNKTQRSESPLSRPECSGGAVRVPLLQCRERCNPPDPTKASTPAHLNLIQKIQSSQLPQGPCCPAP